MSTAKVRPATAVDIPAMLQLSATKREQYEQYQPIFHRRAAGALEAQEPYLRSLVERDDVVVLVAETDGAVIGFGTAEIHTAPPVYDPGGPAALVDDFIVAAPDLWATAGRQILDALIAELRRRGIVVVIAVCGHRDEPKRRTLTEAGLSLASEWYAQSLSTNEQ
jgi:L-amino acid N-acyltransferase YncA